MKISEIAAISETQEKAWRESNETNIAQVFYLLVQLAMHTLNQQERITTLELKLKEHLDAANSH